MNRLLNLEVLEAKDNPSSITIIGSTLHIEASPYSDAVQVDYDDRGTWWNPYDDQLNARLTNAYESLQATVNVLSVNAIGFLGYDGNDTFINNASHSAYAYGGNGDDVLVG